MNVETNPSEFAVDLTNCDREPIHVLGTIQPFGFLIAVTSDWLVAHVSDNVAGFIGVSPVELLGRPLADFVDQDALHDIRNRITILNRPDAVERLFSLQLVADRPAFDVAVHLSGRKVVIEAEPASPRDLDAISLFRPLMARLQAVQEFTAFCREGARQIRALTGFDRVMVYRFDSDGGGEVVAEAKASGMDSFLGLHYPASDIPVQARALYLRSVFRIISDIDAPPSAIVPHRGPEGEPLDQSISILRAVSPIHLEYLRNMGVHASMSISIIIENKLWGLFACHHNTPHLPNFALRSAAELFGQIFAMMLENRERTELRRYEVRARALSDRLIASIARDDELLRNADWLGEVMAESIPADGVGVLVDGSVALSGLTPSREDFKTLLSALNRTTVSQVFTTDHIAGLLPAAAAYASRAAGLLAIPLSRSPRDYVVLFRAERLRSVRWAGNPEKPVEFGPNGTRLIPRQSFAEWSELVRGRAVPFTTAEISVAEALRTALLEVVLRISEAAGEERKRSQEKQELLIAELNHRVRNILALIRGLISQTRQSSLSAESFAETLESRVQALARAHDQITADQWGPARLRDMIETEMGAYLGAKRSQVSLEGPNVLIAPAAFTTLALIVHELSTNAAKYGALSDSGRVAIAWHLDGEGDLRLSWRETGGPAVLAPTRLGLGSTIINRSIVFDLGGTADVKFRLSGLEAEFCVPARYVVKVVEEAPGRTHKAAEAGSSVQVLDGLSVLLLEDSLIVALDGEDALRTLGAKEVHTVPSLARALEVIEAGVDFAVLDFNLGPQTSLPAAELLRARGTRFVFATGYGDGLDLPDHLRTIGVVKKPYDAASLARAIADAQPV